MSKCKRCGKEIEDGKKHCLACKQRQIEFLKKVGKSVVGVVAVGVLGLTNIKKDN